MKLSKSATLNESEFKGVLLEHLKEKGVELPAEQTELVLIKDGKEIPVSFDEILVRFSKQAS